MSVSERIVAVGGQKNELSFWVPIRKYPFWVMDFRIEVSENWVTVSIVRTMREL
jgi:hypothetical protein